MARQQSKKRPKRKPAPAPAPAQLAPDFELAEPESTRYVRGLAYIVQQTGIHVNEYTMLTLGAVFACIRAISETIAWLPWQQFEKVGNSRLRRSDNIEWLLDTQANPETAAMPFRESLLAAALSWGNGYAEIERDGAGRPVWLWQITPDRVCLERDDSGRLFYRVENGAGQDPTYLSAADMYHLHGLGLDGLVGYNIARLAQLSISIGISLDQASGSFFENDSTPGGILSHPNRVNPEAQKRLRETWQKTHGGAKKKRTVAILEEGMTWTQTGSPPEQSQMVEQRQITPSEICRWFRVPPHKIADLSRATFSNIEEQNIEWVVDCLMPWNKRLETEADIKLFGRTNRGRVYTKLNVNALMRGDSVKRAAFYTAMFDRGILSVNEIREKEDMDAIGSDGDKRFVPLNMQLLEKAGEEPPAPAAGQPASGDPPKPDEPAADQPADEPKAESRKPKADGLAHLRPVVVDVCQRIARREKGRAADAIKLDPAKREAWLKEFLIDHESYCRAQLAPVFQTLAAVSGMPPEISEKFVAVETALNRDRLAAQAPEFWGQQGIEPDALFIPFTKGVYGS